MEIIFTEHALNRGRERMGWPMQVTKKYAQPSLTEGQYALHDEVMREILYRTCKRHGGLAYLYEGAVFIFQDNVLVTLYPVTGSGAKELFEAA